MQTAHETAAAEIAAAKAAYLASGGKIKRLPGFTAITPMRPAKRSSTAKPDIKPAVTPGGFVGRAYIAEGVGLGVKQLFHGGIYNHLLPKPTGGTQMERFTKADADLAIRAIRAFRRNNSPDPALHVDRHYICDALGINANGLFDTRYSYVAILPEPAFIQRGRGKPKQWYLKTEADAAIEKIQQIRSSRK